MERIYSTNYKTIKARIYLQDEVKYEKSKRVSMACARARYHSEDDEIRNKYRAQRKEWNRKAYLKKKAEKNT